ncbi:MAG: hypothetical protein CSA05_01420 [Bacteroidia bacterium]|nr:MAG: hypothetical protein CSA05_01420 [Bacteroidia bacterium]
MGEKTTKTLNKEACPLADFACVVFRLIVFKILHLKLKSPLYAPQLKNNLFFRDRKLTLRNFTC